MCQRVRPLHNVVTHVCACCKRYATPTPARAMPRRCDIGIGEEYERSLLSLLPFLLFFLFFFLIDRPPPPQKNTHTHTRACTHAHAHGCVHTYAHVRIHMHSLIIAAVVCVLSIYARLATTQCHGHAQGKSRWRLRLSAISGCRSANILPGKRGQSNSIPKQC